MLTERDRAGGGLYGLTFAHLQEIGPGPAHARTLWRALYRERSVALWDRTDFPPVLRRWLGQWDAAAPLRVGPDGVVISSDGFTRRFLAALGDGRTIETVLMGYPGRHTVCASTQAGCAMGCVFCATGQQGFTRHLTVAEIVAQVVHGQRVLDADGGGRVRNLVLMGMGEPLHNYEATMTALEILSDTRGLNIGPSRMTVSTVGVVPGILRWIEERRPYHLAVSLHAADQLERARLVPAARRWPLEELMAACRRYCAVLGRRIFFEWTLIQGQNDSASHAERVALLLRGIDAHVNLIPLNPTEGFHGHAASGTAAQEFQTVLRRAGIPSTVRQRRGIDVEAGCGQLRAALGKAAA